MNRSKFLKRVPSFSLSGKVSCKMLEKSGIIREIAFGREIMTVAKIVFASMTGNTEEIADIVADKFRDLGVEVDVG